MLNSSSREAARSRAREEAVKSAEEDVREARLTRVARCLGESPRGEASALSRPEGPRAMRGEAAEEALEARAASPCQLAEDRAGIVKEPGREAASRSLLCADVLRGGLLPSPSDIRL